MLLLPLGLYHPCSARRGIPLWEPPHVPPQQSCKTFHHSFCLFIDYWSSRLQQASCFICSTQNFSGIFLCFLWISPTLLAFLIAFFPIKCLEPFYFSHLSGPSYLNDVFLLLVICFTCCLAVSASFFSFLKVIFLDKWDTFALGFHHCVFK